MKFQVELAQLVRETRTVVVEADSLEDLEHRLSEAYEADDVDGAWDTDGGCEEGTHTIIGPYDGDGEYHLITLPPKEG